MVTGRKLAVAALRTLALGLNYANRVVLKSRSVVYLCLQTVAKILNMIQNMALGKHYGRRSLDKNCAWNFDLHHRIWGNMVYQTPAHTRRSGREPRGIQVRKRLFQ